MTRALIKASLPAPRGCGLFKAAEQAPCLWWSSVASCLTDPLLFALRDGLQSFVPFAFESIQETLGVPSSVFWSQISALFPPTADGLLDGTYAPDAPLTTKLNLAFLRCVKRRKAAILDGFLASEEPSASLTPADVINGFARSGAGRIFAESLKRTTGMVTFSNDEYIGFTRCFLALPPKPTVGELKEQAGFDYPVQSCKVAHGSNPYLDACANHASSNCPATYRARQKKHRDITLVLAYAAKEAGLVAKVEPDTRTLLLGSSPGPSVADYFRKTRMLTTRRNFNKS